VKKKKKTFPHFNFLNPQGVAGTRSHKGATSISSLLCHNVGGFQLGRDLLIRQAQFLNAHPLLLGRSVDTGQGVHVLVDLLALVQDGGAQFHDEFVILGHFHFGVQSDKVFAALRKRAAVGHYLFHQSHSGWILGLVGLPRFVHVRFGGGGGDIIVAAVRSCGAVQCGTTTEISRFGCDSVSQATERFKHGQRQAVYVPWYKKRNMSECLY
jgi:hypothetical protein